MLRQALASLAAVPRSALQSSARTFSSAQSAFEKAQADLKTLKEEPETEVKLKIYALFKQATVGDVTGSRPGMMDFVGRAKYDAYVKLKGMDKDAAMGNYTKLVNTLLGEQAATPAAATVEGLEPVDGLEVSIKDKVFHIRLNRPKKFNALTVGMYSGLIEALNFGSANTSTTVTVISAAGEYFTSGNDLSNFAKAATASKEVVKEMAESAGAVLEQYIKAYIDHEKPLIGLINGPTIGIGATVLPLFDMVIASDKFTCQTPFASLGQSPEGASSYSFPLLMGPVKASEVLLMGRKLGAAEAANLGLVSMVVPMAEFEEVAWKEVNKMSLLPPESLRLNKILLRNNHRAALHKANLEECKLIVQRWQSKECAQAIGKFMSRKK